MNNSTGRASRGKARPRKLKKPRPDFPLSIHRGTGYWCRKVHGRVYYFGRVADDPKGTAALAEWERVREDLYAGREPRPKSGELTVADLCNKFLGHKEQLRNNGELSPLTFRAYYDACRRVVDVFGRGREAVDVGPDDFRRLRVELAKTRGATALRNEMQRVRSLFKFAFDEGLILTPVRFGQGFSKPTLDVVRRERGAFRAENGPRMFEAVEILAILDAAGQPLRSMVLLAANCGFGNSDLSSLPLSAVDLDAGWVDYPRPKTGVDRRVPLWPETVEALREWLPRRPKAKDRADRGLLFLTQYGNRWVKVNAAGTLSNGIGGEFDKVLRRLGLKRPRLGFYGLRHGFETIAGDTADQVAVDSVMGHVAVGMSAVYRERIGDDRLRRVVEHVRAWLFESGSEGAVDPPVVDSPRSFRIVG